VTTRRSAAIDAIPRPLATARGFLPVLRGNAILPAVSLTPSASRRRPRRAGLFLLFLFLVALSYPVWALPFLEPRIGNTPFEGPADWEATALFWNPAALGPLRGRRLTLLGSGRLGRGTIARTPICTSTGLPGPCTGGGTDTRSFAPVALAQDHFSGFGALTWNFSENLTLAFGVFGPWLSCPSGSRCRATAQGGSGGISPPTEYQLQSESFTTIYFTAGAAFRLGRKLHLGVTISAVDSFAEVSFYRDTTLDRGSAGVGMPCDSSGTPCGYENPSGAQRVRIRGDSGTFWQTSISRGVPLPTGIGTNLGLLYHPTERFWLGFSWQRVFPLQGGIYTSGSANRTEVTPALSAGAPCGGGPCRGGGAILYSLPDVWHLGARIFLREDLELSLWGRVVTYGGYNRNETPLLGLVLRLNGTPVTRAGVPNEIVIDRGLIPQFTGEIGLRWQVRSWLRVGGAFLAGSSAVRRDYVSAGSLDAPKVGGIVGVEWRVRRWLGLMSAYSFTGYLPTTTRGAQDPGATVRCVDAQYNIDVCGETLAGRGLPSNAGRYTYGVHNFTLGVFFQFL
jgi:hypothetical protein